MLKRYFTTLSVNIFSHKATLLFSSCPYPPIPRQEKLFHFVLIRHHYYDVLTNLSSRKNFFAPQITYPFKNLAPNDHLKTLQPYFTCTFPVNLVIFNNECSFSYSHASFSQKTLLTLFSAAFPPTMPPMSPRSFSRLAIISVTLFLWWSVESFRLSSSFCTLFSVDWNKSKNCCKHQLL